MVRSPIRVAMVTTALTLDGGVGRAVNGLLRNLRDVDVTLVATRTENPDVRFEPVRERRKTLLLHNYPQARAFQRRVDALQPDVAHAHDSTLLRPHVVTMHSSWLHFLTTMSWRFRVFYPRNWFLRPWERRYVRRAKRVLAVSEGLREAICRLHGIPPDQVRTVGNGVDHEEFYPRVQHARIRRRHGIPLEAPVILFVGNEFERKGLGPLLRGLAACSRRDAWLLVVGRRDPSTYQALAQRLGVQHRVVWAGYVGREDLPYYYSTSQAFAMLSSYEPLGLVYLEAMACGVPIVASRNDGSVEIMKGNEGAFVDSVASDASVASALERVLDDPSLGQNARRRALEFNWSDVARRTRDVYEEVCAR